jgi:hypothetical protein
LAGSKERNRFRNIIWDEYDSVHQKYLEISKYCYYTFCDSDSEIVLIFTSLLFLNGVFDVSEK